MSATVDTPPAPEAPAEPGAAAEEAARRHRATVGFAYGLAAYLAWGLSPIYFKAVSHVSAWEILAHRIVWSVPLLAVVVWLGRRWSNLLAALRDRRMLALLALTTGLIACNWFLYIYAVATDRVLHASLGYFINPLVNIALGAIFLGERMTRVTGAGVAMAAAGVAFLAIWQGSLPWIAMVLPLSFGFYALLRKQMTVAPATGLLVETSLLLPPAIGFLFWAHLAGGERFGLFGATDVATTLLLPGAGLMTMLPLLWFTAAAHRLTFITLGFMQYIAPTGQMLLGWLAYGEVFTVGHAVAFGGIWAGLGLYSAQQMRLARRRRRARRDLATGAGADGGTDG